jgi:hypothetical protein
VGGTPMKAKWAASIAAAIAVCAALTACGGGSSSSSIAAVAAPGQWTSAELAHFESVGGSAGQGTASDDCIAKEISDAMSYGDAMAVVAVAPASTDMSSAQIQAALIAKYGQQEGSTLYAEFAAVAANNSC